MIELRQLLYVLAAADQRSFARAASQLRMKQSTLSRKVTRLEDQLGFRLFDRTTSGAKLTTSARAFLEDARQLVDQAAQLEQRARAMRNSNRARLALGYSGALFDSRIGHLLHTFLRDYPDVRFDGVEKAPGQLLEALACGKVDAVIVPAGCDPKCLATLPLWEEPLCAIFGVQHHLAGKTSVDWHDLAHEHLVLPATGAGPAVLDLIRNRFAGSAARPLMTVHEASNETVCRLVSLGGGVCVQGASTFRHAGGGLAVRPIQEAGSDVSLAYLLHWSPNNDNPVLREFRELVANLIFGAAI